MGRVAMVLWILLVMIVVAMAYVRLAPSDPARWHVATGGAVAEIADKDFKGGVIRVIPAGPEGLARFDRIARASPRTAVLAGAVDEGMITYVTRSAVWGFPDYTTVRAGDGQLVIHARLRFGRSDFGVNRARVEGWVAAFQAG